MWETIPARRSQKAIHPHMRRFAHKKLGLFHLIITSVTVLLRERAMWYMLFSFVTLAATLCTMGQARTVTELHGTNFELTLSTFKYIAILFYDDTNAGRNMKNNWMLAASDVDLPKDCDMAQISGEDFELQELIDAYDITLPSIRVFRRGIMADYRGPADMAGMAKYIMEDAKPSVGRISSLLEIHQIVSNNQNTVIFSLFNEEDMVDDDIMDGYSIDAWGQYQAAADSLRGHAQFFVVTSPDVAKSLKLTPADLPAVFMISNEGEGILRYSGEILELNLSEWVLRFSSPAMGELSVDTTQGELYTTQFFSSRKLKFILFVSPEQLTEELLETWASIAEVFAEQAIFAYQTQPVADVLEYFDIDAAKDVPVIAAHNPTPDSKYKSDKLQSTEFGPLQRFVAGVITGVVNKVTKSEPLPKPSSNPVVTAVGSNVLDIVNQPGKDVLLVVFAPWCTHCKKLLPTYEILARAVQGEPRIVIAKINGESNDIPAAWGVKAYPTLLWFRAADKDQLQGDLATLAPRDYWDAGHSLHELASFVQRQGSFDLKSLRVASNEQLATLQGDEEALRVQYEIEERHQMRNTGRVVYDLPLQDYVMGEVVFDGKRWHVALAAALAFLSASLLLHAFYKYATTKPPKRRTD